MRLVYRDNLPIFQKLYAACICAVIRSNRFPDTEVNVYREIGQEDNFTVHNGGNAPSSDQWQKYATYVNGSIVGDYTNESGETISALTGKVI